MKHIGIIKGCLVGCILCMSSYGQDFASDSYGKYGAEFLKLPRHSQSAALGNAVTAWAEDLAGLQFNPSLLAYNKKHHVKMSYSMLTVDRKHYSVDYATPTYGLLNYAISLTNFGVNDIDGRDESGFDEKDFSDNEIGADVVAAGQVPGLFAYGLALRYIHQNIGDFGESAAHGYGLDIGGHYSPIDRIGIGLSFQNIFSNMNWETGRTDAVVPLARLGIHGQIIDSVLAVELDFLKPFPQPLETSLGIQGTVLKILSIRAGMINAVTYDADGSVWMDPEFFMGVGIRYQQFGVDYAGMKPGSEFEMGHKISLVVHFP